MEVYGHLTPGYLQAKVARLQFGLPIPDAVAADEVAEQKLAANAESDPFAASLLQDSEDAPLASSVDPADLQSIPPVLVARPTGFEPVTYGSGASNVRLVGSSKASQAGGSVQVGARGRVQPSHGTAELSSPFAAPVLQTLMGGATSPRVAPRLLKVGEVAERLGVSTATVYALCKRGTLQHIRVANAIRVPEAALAAFLG